MSAGTIADELVTHLVDDTSATPAILEFVRLYEKGSHRASIAGAP